MNRRRSDNYSGMKVIRNYCIVKDLGKGYNAKVKLAVNMLTNQMVAIKIFNTQKIKSRDSVSPLKRNSMLNIIKEVEIIKSMNHPHIAKFEEIIEDTRKTYVVMEYVDGGSV
jgi:serine/threonine protein kinase